jgi:hypothetical protein
MSWPSSLAAWPRELLNPLSSLGRDQCNSTKFEIFAQYRRLISMKETKNVRSLYRGLQWPNVIYFMAMVTLVPKRVPINGEISYTPFAPSSRSIFGGQLLRRTLVAESRWCWGAGGWEGAARSSICTSKWNRRCSTTIRTRRFLIVDRSKAKANCALWSAHWDPRCPWSDYS